MYIIFMIELPLDVIIYILSYDDRFVIKNGKILDNNRISKMDERCLLLSYIPKKIYNTRDLQWEVDLIIGYVKEYKGYKYLKLYSNIYSYIYSVNLDTNIDIGSKFAKIFLNKDKHLIL